jgi:hypothetical protein
MNQLLRFLPIITLFLFSLIFLPSVWAQGLSDNSYTQSQPYALGGTNNLTAPINAQNFGNGTFGLDWRWVLPVLLIGAGLLFLRGSRERVDRSYYNPRRDYTVAFQINRLKKPLKAA